MLLVGKKPAIVNDKIVTNIENKESKGIAQKRTIYFEAGKSGSWKPVHVPSGMTDKQLLK